MAEIEKNLNYQKAYDDAQETIADLAGRLADLESENEELSEKINRIKRNPIWKLSKPFRICMHAFIRQKQRLVNCGGLRGVIAKIKYKKHEKKAMKSYGTSSFPSELEREKQLHTKFEKNVKISILVPLYNTPENFLRAMIESVLAQTYANWELCLADGSDSLHENVGKICKEYMNSQPLGQQILYKKLKENEGISGNTNECYKMSTGDYIGLFDHDDILHPSVLFEYVKAINEKNADYLYCDETTFKGNDINKMLTMHFKPDYAIDNLRANNYICHFSVFSRELLEGTELFRSKYDGSQDHDMILRLTDRAKNVVHVPKLLYYWRCHAGSVASGIQAKTYAINAAKGAVSDHLRKHGFQNFKIESTRAFETIFRIRYQIIGRPKISIIIPNKDHKDDLCRCITSIFEKSSYSNFEVIIVENNSESEEILKYYDTLKENYLEKVKIIKYTGKFNYSKVNNLGVKAAEGEYIVLLNNDTQIISINWLEELLMYAQRDDVGAVGAKLYYPDKTIQHAGVVLGLGAHRTAGHSHYKQPKENLGYMGRLCYAQNVSAVTGACLMVKKKDFITVGGLEETLEISLNDVDFCMKLRERGLLNVFTPFAELYHYESISRGLDDVGEKAKRYERESEIFRKKWALQLEQGDPYYNVNFSLDKSDFSIKM